MSRISARFIVVPEDQFGVIDVVEKTSYRFPDARKAKQLCEQLQSMHGTIGMLLEELDKFKFPRVTFTPTPIQSAQLNADFDAQEAFGEQDIVDIKNSSYDTSKMTNEEFLAHLQALLAKLNKANSENIAAQHARLDAMKAVCDKVNKKHG